MIDHFSTINYEFYGGCFDTAMDYIFENDPCDEIRFVT
jgi:hypothetical protein